MADDELNYDHLAVGLKEALQNDSSAFNADRLQKYTGIQLINRFPLWLMTQMDDMFIYISCSVAFFSKTGMCQYILARLHNAKITL